VTFGCDENSLNTVKQLPMNDTNTSVAVIALTEVQKIAAERRALAEQILLEARDLEERLAKESLEIASLIAAAEAARTSERDAAERVRIAHEDEARAQIELSTARKALLACRDARSRADKAVMELQTRIESLSEANGLTTEAAKHAIERRIADATRRGAIPGRV
jgi:hypothetical protein